LLDVLIRGGWVVEIGRLDGATAGTRAEIGHLNVRYNTGAPEGAWQQAVDSGRPADITHKDPWDAYFDILLAEMTRHPLFNLTADTWSSRIDGPLAEQTRHTICFAGYGHTAARPGKLLARAR
jgi:hypothetical protein